MDATGGTIEGSTLLAGVTSNAGMPALSIVASLMPVRGAAARFIAGAGLGIPYEPGGPPQMPRWGLAHLIAPAHLWRMM